jgi:hypothetical protein
MESSLVVMVYFALLVMATVIPVAMAHTYMALLGDAFAVPMSLLPAHVQISQTLVLIPARSLMDSGITVQGQVPLLARRVIRETVVRSDDDSRG